MDFTDAGIGGAAVAVATALGNGIYRLYRARSSNRRADDAAEFEQRKTEWEQALAAWRDISTSQHARIETLESRLDKFTGELAECHGRAASLQARIDALDKTLACRVPGVMEALEAKSFSVDPEPPQA